MQKVLTQYGEGFVLEKDDSGRHVSYLVSGPGFKTWIAASDMPIGFNDEEISEPKPNPEHELPYTVEPETDDFWGFSTIVPDEEDVDFLADGVIENKLNAILIEIDDILSNAKQGQLLRDGIHVVLAGKPNAGKSSLLNCLSGTERAIVTDVAGTTRDTLQETLVLNGLTIHLTDTAGLRRTADKVEKIGIDRAKNAISQADILLLVYDVSGEIDPMLLAKELFSEGDYGDFDKLKQKLIFVANKTDLLVKMNVPRETLVNEILSKELLARKHHAQEVPGAHDEILGLEKLDKAIVIDQSAIGRTPRSNPATYTGVFTQIRELFAGTPEANIRGYKAGRFSFNVKGGRC